MTFYSFYIFIFYILWLYNPFFTFPYHSVVALFNPELLVHRMEWVSNILWQQYFVWHHRCPLTWIGFPRWRPVDEVIVLNGEDIGVRVGHATHCHNVVAVVSLDPGAGVKPAGCVHAWQRYPLPCLKIKF